MAELLRNSKKKTRGELIDTLLKDVLTPSQYKDCYDWYYNLLDGFGIEILLLAKEVGIEHLLISSNKPKRILKEEEFPFSAAHSALLRSCKGLPEKHRSLWPLDLGKIITVPDRKPKRAKVVVEDLGSNLEESVKLVKVSDVGPLEKAIPMGFDI